MTASPSSTIVEIELCAHHIEQYNDNLRREISQYTLLSAAYVVVGLLMIGVSVFLVEGMADLLLKAGGALVAFVVPGYPFSKIYVQRRLIEKNEFLCSSLNHPQVPHQRKKDIINMVYGSLIKGLES